MNCVEWNEDMRLSPYKEKCLNEILLEIEDKLNQIEKMSWWDRVFNYKKKLKEIYENSNASKG